MIDIVKIKELCNEGKYIAYTRIQQTQDGAMRFIYLIDMCHGETVCLGKEKIRGSFKFLGVVE